MSYPKSDSAFWELIRDEGIDMYGKQTAATNRVVFEVGDECNPESWNTYEDGFLKDFGYEGNDADFLDWIINDVIGELETKEGVEEFINRRIETAKELNQLEEFFDIGNTEDCDYPDVESFLNDINYDNAIKIIQESWNRVCTEEE